MKKNGVDLRLSGIFWFQKTAVFLRPLDMSSVTWSWLVGDHPTMMCMFVEKKDSSMSFVPESTDWEGARGTRVKLREWERKGSLFSKPSRPFLAASSIPTTNAMADRYSGQVQSYGYPSTAGTSQIVSRAVAAAAANNHHSNRRGGRSSKRYSVSAFYSMAAEQDNEVEDELAQG